MRLLYPHVEAGFLLYTMLHDIRRYHPFVVILNVFKYPEMKMV